MPTRTSASKRKSKSKSPLTGVLSFHSETGTEGGIWAFQSERFIHYKTPKHGVLPDDSVYDANDRRRKGRVAKAWKADGRPLPDPSLDAKAELLQKQLGDEISVEELIEKTIELESEAYHAEPGEAIRVEVEWEDGTTEERLADTLLTRRWSYEGLHYLGNGDHLTIFEKNDPTKVHWEGVIRLKRYPLFTELVYGPWNPGMWIHADQKGWDREEWARLFFEEYPAQLVPK